MFTFCPHCFAIYQVTPTHLDQAGGQLRCGECRQVYRAIDYLFENLAAARSVVETQRADGSRSEDASSQFIPEQEEAGWEVTAAARPGWSPSNSWQSRTVSKANIVSGVAVGFMALLLGLQWVYFNRDILAAETGWRSRMERFCDVFHCDLPMRVDLARIGIVERDVRKHPVAENALLINVTFENQAEFIQSYPLFEVSFTDKLGNLVAMRRFSPGEYLGEGIDLESGMPPQSPVQAVLEVLDPGARAISFQFGFL